MIKIFFNIIISLLATLIQIVCLPINLVMSQTLPNVSSQITIVTNSINDAFTGMGWIIGFLPAPVTACLIFILTCEIAKHSVYLATHSIIKVWGLFQTIKFW